jgi:hypothetical protein
MMSNRVIGPQAKDANYGGLLLVVSRTAVDVVGCNPIHDLSLGKVARDVAPQCGLLRQFGALAHVGSLPRKAATLLSFVLIPSSDRHPAIFMHTPEMSAAASTAVT